MDNLQHKVYNLGIRLLDIGLGIAAPFHAKARESVRGRRATDRALAGFAARATGKKVVWVHCASLGEFEQGRPVIEQIAVRYPDAAILLTFFSPSGYQMRKNFQAASLVGYMPVDTPARARRFIEAVAPDLAIFVKYEFWLNHLFELHKQGIPILLASAVFHRKQSFFGVGGKLFRKVLPMYERIFVQNRESAGLLDELGVSNYEVAGDTRIDRVAQIAERSEPIPVAEAFAGGSPVLVVGSSWPADERILQRLINNDLPANWKVILAPHEVDEPHLAAIEEKLSIPAIRYAEAQKAGAGAARCLIIDNIGMLSRLYRYGRVAYIGGGFGAGIHNTLEPLAFGLPVIIGPKYGKFGEAVAMIAQGGMYSVRNAEELSEAFTALLPADRYEKAQNAARVFIESNKGATESIMKYIAQRELL